MKLSIFLLACYRDTVTKQHFVRAVKKNSIYSNCEDDVIESIWDLVELFSENTLENVFEDLLPEKKVSL